MELAHDRVKRWALILAVFNFLVRISISVISPLILFLLHCYGHSWK